MTKYSKVEQGKLSTAYIVYTVHNEIKIQIIDHGLLTDTVSEILLWLTATTSETEILSIGAIARVIDSTETRNCLAHRTI